MKKIINSSTGIKILSIETSCDETAISIIEVLENKKNIKFKILGNKISSQIELHAKYGGVFPMMAKREHGKNILHILENVLQEAKMYSVNTKYILNKKLDNKISKILDRENEILDRWPDVIPKIKCPNCGSKPHRRAYKQREATSRSR